MINTNCSINNKLLNKNKMVNEIMVFTNLPNDILYKIMELCNIRDLCNISNCNKIINKISSSNYIWKSKIKKLGLKINKQISFKNIYLEKIIKDIEEKNNRKTKTIKNINYVTFNINKFNIIIKKMYLLKKNKIDRNNDLTKIKIFVIKLESLIKKGLLNDTIYLETLEYSKLVNII